MNARTQETTPEEEFDLASVFARILREVYRGEPWERVEPNAARIWQRIEPLYGRSWEQVRDRLRADWPPAQLPGQP